MLKKISAGFSIKKRLIVSILMTLVIFLTITMLITYLFARHEIEEIYDAHLSQSAKMLQSFMDNLSTTGALATDNNSVYEAWYSAIVSTRHTEIEYFATGHPYEHNFIFQIYRQGELIWQSNPSNLFVKHDPHFSGFGNLVLNQTPWRFFQLPIQSDPSSSAVLSGQDYILVAENRQIRDEITNEIALSSALPLLLLIPTLLIIIIVLIDRNLIPLKALRQAISQRHANKLDHIYLADPPIELQPLIITLNQLLSELEQARTREKRFTQMAAHELKTPLTILRINAQNAIASKNPEEVKEIFNNILQGIDRTDRLIHQLLTLAKIEQITTYKLKRIDLSTLLTTEIANLVPIAIKQNQEISFEGSSVYFEAEELLLPLLFRNMIDNAIRYSGTGSKIMVKLTESTNKIIVTVTDSGETIPKEIQERLFENFYRGNHNKGNGAGLGMSIIKDIANLHNGQLVINPVDELTTNRGNIFRVCFFKEGYFAQ